MTETVQAGCLFCRGDIDNVFIRGKLGFARWDGHPVSDGHALVCPNRHVASYFDVTDRERAELWDLVDAAKKVIDARYQPHGYNVGINVGQPAGQSVFHVHIHLIPRYRGDMENPRGGVRGVIPEKRLYP